MKLATDIRRIAPGRDHVIGFYLKDGGRAVLPTTWTFEGAQVRHQGLLADQSAGRLPTVEYVAVRHVDDPDWADADIVAWRDIIARPLRPLTPHQRHTLEDIARLGSQASSRNVGNRGACQHLEEKGWIHAEDVIGPRGGLTYRYQLTPAAQEKLAR